MFRSEEMLLCQMFIQSGVAYATVSELGETGAVQFRDMNTELSLHQKKYVSDVRRCDEMERNIRYIESVIGKASIKLPEIGAIIPRAPNLRELWDLETTLDRAASAILVVTENDEKLRSELLNLKQYRRVLEAAQNYFSNEEDLCFDSFMTGGIQQNFSQLEIIAGVIDCNLLFSFERMLWRMARGKVLIHLDLNYPIRNWETCNDIPKCVFLVVFQGKELRNRIQKVCDGFHAKTYHCPKWFQVRLKFLQDLSASVNDLTTVIYQNEEHRRRVIEDILNMVPSWKIMVKKVKAIFFTLNMFNVDISKNCLIGECWMSAKNFPFVKQSLLDCREGDDSIVSSFLNVIKTDDTVPTYNRTNKFTKGFQKLIDAYGIASYREINPALYTIITFPFLFAVMFGDLGHAFILLLFGTWMCMCEKKLEKVCGGEIWSIFFGGRYVILLMGIFSAYTGFIYNDFFSKSINIFGSNWIINYNSSTVLKNPSLQLNPSFSGHRVYPMGMDPVWQFAENRIIFLNSYKMKLSIIFGVFQMFFGVCMSAVNFNHARKRVSIILEFLPQILFLVSLFGYLGFMMFFKWARYSAQAANQVQTPGCAPSVLIMFINMLLFGHSKPLDGCKEFMFDGQHSLQIVFISIAFVCIPWMLLGKPLYIFCTRKNNIAGNQQTVFNSQDMNQETDADGYHVEMPLDEEHPLLNSLAKLETNRHENEEVPMSEVCILQAIHTIEYILSTISHTASYLRLWALSLAHAQLSEVLWKMVLSVGLKNPTHFGSVLLFLAFGTWSMLTLAILVMMEGLSAFLHTLRLHWVEFMSKFYTGLGYPFEPFSFKNILDEEDK